MGSDEVQTAIGNEDFLEGLSKGTTMNLRIKWYFKLRSQNYTAKRAWYLSTVYIKHQVPLEWDKSFLSWCSAKNRAARLEAERSGI